MNSALILSVLTAFCVVELFVFFIWLAAYQIQKTSIIDIFWSLLVFSAALIYWIFLSSQGGLDRVYLFLFGLWAFRLALHIYWRGRDHGEDPRYQVLRRQWGAAEKQKMLKFYFQQGVAAWFLALPFLIVFSSGQRHLSFWGAAGIVVWLLSFIGETLSDIQLTAFKKNPQNQGRVCRVGFWRYSRHPNYFFEWLNWVAWAWIAMAYPFGFMAIICPVLMYYVLNHVSGVPLAEKQSLKSRSMEYQEYQRVTSPFFPWLPKMSEILK